MDWKSSLEALKSNLPEGEVTDHIAAEASPEESKQTDKLRVLLDRKGRKGKDATIVEGFTCDDDEVARIASVLKQKLGVGGSARGGEILIQGDKRQAVAAQLNSLGYNCKII